MALTMLTPPADPAREYQRLRDAGAAAVESGRYEEALALFDGALEQALALEDPVLVDRAFCNRATVVIFLDRVENEIPELRAILMRNQDAENSRLAAHHVSEHFEAQKAFKKALFYARIALERSEALDRKDWIASSHNRIGNILMAESYFDEACAEYEKALAHSDQMAPVWRARIHDNVGYCRILQSRYDEGFRLLYKSLQTLRRFDAQRFLISTHLDLCFAHLEVGRWRDARRHGEASLKRAQQFNEIDSIKNSLYLLGQTASMAGEGDASARAYFSQLQDYFPGAPFLTDFLLSIDVRKIINLKA